MSAPELPGNDENSQKIDPSDTVKDFIRKLLARPAENRMTVDVALQHPWMTDPGILHKHHLADTMLNLKRFCARKRLKSKILHRIDSVEELESDIRDVNKEIELVNSVLDSLNQIAIVSDMTCEEDNGVQLLAKDKKLRKNLKLFDDIYQNCK